MPPVNDLRRRCNPPRHHREILRRRPGVLSLQNHRRRADEGHVGGVEEAEVGGGDAEIRRERREPVGGVVVDDPVGLRARGFEEEGQWGFQ